MEICADKKRPNISEHVFVGPHSSMLYRKHFKDIRRVLVEDGFVSRNNREYPPSEPFSELYLINPRKRISPFKIAYQQGDENYLLRLRYDVEFLCHLGSELSKPITPDVAELEYLPTQYLCELIKKSQFDGVKFQSSVGNGVNYTLSSQSKIKPISVLSYYIKQLKYTPEKI